MLQTRINGNSKDNGHFVIVDKEGTTVALIEATSNNDSNFKISTLPGFKIDKANGHCSDLK